MLTRPLLFSDRCAHWMSSSHLKESTCRSEGHFTETSRRSRRPEFLGKGVPSDSAQLAVEQKEKEASDWFHVLTNMKELRRLLVAVAALTSVQTNGAQTIQVYQVMRIQMTQNFSIH